MLLKDFLKEGAARLESFYLAREAMNIMLILCEERIGTKRFTHLVEPDYSINEKDFLRLSSDVERLSSGEPIQYVLGYADFCEFRFTVTPDVLIPRPETEIMCKEAIRVLGTVPKPKVLDLCTGSGCIAWTIALNVPGSVVFGTDISQKALEVAAGQEFSSELEETGASAPVFIKADLLGDEKALGETGFDMIVSNPPYIKESEKALMRPNVLDFEPSSALFVPDEDPLLFYRHLARWSRSLLSSGGRGMVEINELLGEETKSLFVDAGFEEVVIVKDFYVKNRFVSFRK